uniref:Uncharacterized protein n=1 Tax=Panagrolaimus sp. ES5 TaxID=591445 RepID=A0AC34FCM5_9BILA
MIEFTVCNFVQRQAMNQLTNDPGAVKRRKSCVTAKETSESTGTNIGSRAKNLIDRAMGRAGEHRHLIETSVDEYGTPETTDRRNPPEKQSYDNDGLEVTVATPPRRKSKVIVENGKVAVPAKSFNNSVKSVHDDRWREREAERLANWARVSVEINEPPSTIGQGSLWNRLKTQTIQGESENVQKVHDSNPKSKLSGLGTKWTTAIKQMQQNK